MAAKGEASLIVRLVDNATAGLKTLKSGIDQLKKNWLLLAGVVGTATAFLVESVKAFAEQELAVKKLDRALLNQGIASGSARKELEAYASELERITAFSDDTIIQAMALGTTFGLTGQRLKEATKSAADLSAGIGIDLQSAMMLLGKAAKGEVGTLARYGIKIKEGIPDSEKFAAVLEQIGMRFGGAAASNADTFTGKVTKLKNAFNNLQEQIGGLLVPALTKFVEIAMKAVELTAKFGGNALMLGVNAVKAVSGIGAMSAGMKAAKAVTGDSSGEESLKKGNEDLAASMEKVRVAREARDAMAQQQAKDTAQSEVDEAGFATAEQARLRLESLRGVSQAVQDAKDEELTRQLQADGQMEAAKDLQDAREKDRAKQRVAVASQTLSMVASLSNAKSKEIAAIGKAAAIAQATMDTYAAANKALSQGGIFGFAMAALVTAAGLANVARIGGVQLAEGGVVMPRAGGTQATIGEGGRPEAVIPLGDDRARDSIRDTLGGGGSGLTVNIYAGAFAGDRAQAQAFAEFVDQELYRLARNGKALGDYLG